MQAVDRMLDVGSATDVAAGAAATTPARRRGRRRLLPPLTLPIFWMSLVVVFALAAPWLPFIADPEQLFTGQIARTPSWGHPLGTDAIGRDIFARVVWGSRVSLVSGIGSAAIGLTIGGTLGLVAGYLGGRVDRLIVLLSDAMLAFPALVLMLAMAAVLGPSLWTITLALAVVWIPTFIRITRANTLPVVRREYVAAARSIGTPSWKIMTFDVLPNAMYPVLTYTAVVVAMAIVAEGSLSFLGLGVPPPTPTWGAMIAGGVQALSKSPHIVLMPSLVMVVTIIALNRLGEGVRRQSAARETQI